MKIFRYMKRPLVSSENRKAANQVAYTRKGTDIVETLGSGTASRRKIPTVWVTAKNGQKWEIPVDPKTGRVPDEYLYARFLATHQGSRNGRERNILIDIGKDADMLHEIPAGGFTPQQLIETGWWQGVNESDIIGIDDTGALAFARELEAAAKSAQAQGKKMIFLMPEESAERARQILSKDFNASEIKKAVRNGGIIIKEGNPGRGASGCYVSMQESSSLKTPVIILGKDWNEETLVHEFTHHLRHVDETRGGLTRTPLKLNENGERISSTRYAPKEYNSALNLEEASTVAESLVRIQAPSAGANGYYAATTVHGDTPYKRYLHDRDIMVPGGSQPLRGHRAERQVVQKFGETSISHMGYYRPGSNAGRYLEERKAKGNLPVASKPSKKKKAPDMTGFGTKGPGMVGAEASKSKNRRATKARR
ncbi:MAG: hypothetical protein E7Z70_01970 [Thermoplasmata archaeon]|nr:hypothetical protein [Thermoplasmata archaeon]